MQNPTRARTAGRDQADHATPRAARGQLIGVAAHVQSRGAARTSHRAQRASGWTQVRTVFQCPSFQRASSKRTLCVVSQPGTFIYIYIGFEIRLFL